MQARVQGKQHEVFLTYSMIRYLSLETTCIIGVDKMRTRIRELADPNLKDCVPTSINSPLKD